MLDIDGHPGVKVPDNLVKVVKSVNGKSSRSFKLWAVEVDRLRA